MMGRFEMSTRSGRRGGWPTALAVSLLITLAASADSNDRVGIGRPATPEEITSWDIDVSPDGTGLPPGQGTVQQGARIYAEKCAACHGPTGTEGHADRLIGGHGTLSSERPVKTVGSYWPYATTLYDYIRRAMPYDAPQSLTADEIYAVVAWILHHNGVIAADAVMNVDSLPAVRMPNRDGFRADPRPDVTPRLKP